MCLLVQETGVDSGLYCGEYGGNVAVGSDVGAADVADDGGQVTVPVESCCSDHSNTVLVDFFLIFPVFREALEFPEIDVLMVFDKVQKGGCHWGGS